MRRRLLTVSLSCAALAVVAPAPSALAQDASSTAPGTGQVGASTTAAGSVTQPGGVTASAGVPAGTIPPADASTTVPPPAAGAIAPAPVATTTAPATTAAPAGVSGQTPGSSADDSKTSVVVLAALGALLLFAALFWGAARWWAWEPMWWIRWRHATAEAGWRTSAAWAEFRDWVRLGR